MAGGLLPAGQVSGAIHELIDVASFVPGIVAEAIAVLGRAHGCVVAWSKP